MPEKNDNQITAERVMEDWSELLRKAMKNAKIGLRPWADVDTELTPAEVLLKRAQNDAVNHPSHYTQGGIECIDALKSATTGLQGIEAVCTANAIKYIWRWKHKNGIQDIDKAIWYLKRLKKELESNENK